MSYNTEKHWCRWDDHDCEAAYDEIKRLTAERDLTAFAEHLDRHRPSAAQLAISPKYNDAVVRALEWASQQARAWNKP